MMPYSNEQVPDEREQDDLCAVVLAAGAGSRLRPLTFGRPKPLCPVGNVPLVDHSIARARTVASDVAVNLHHGREALARHLTTGHRDRPVHLSIEEPEALGTAGALGQLRPWIDGRDVVVLNGDTWCPGSLAEAATGWDRERVRLLVVGVDSFTPRSALAGALMPWTEVAGLLPVASGLYEVSWRRLAEDGRIDAVRWDGPCVDCGTPARYLDANLRASGGKSVVGENAVVEGVVERSVVWDGASVHQTERLVDAIRTDTGVTVLVR